MRTLRVLGGLWLDDGDGPSSGRGAQRRRLALLTLLALSPGKRITRDKAIATLWPENTSTEGRRRLSSAVYDLRSLLGDDAIESAGDELWIAPTASLRTDVDQFEAAVARGDFERALTAYGGPLLDGVHLSGAAEFEDWIASQRDRVRQEFLHALEQAAVARTTHGDHRGAQAAALRLVELEPLSGHAALVAVNVLVAAGDRPRALGVLDAHAARVRTELGAEPDDAVLEAARHLRTMNGHRPKTPEVSLVPATTAMETRVDTSPARRVSPVWLRRTVAAVIVVGVLAAAAFRSRATASTRDAAGTLNPTGILAAAAHSTTSAVALKAFSDGEAAYQNGRYDAAAKFFRAAVRQDSTFALAHYRLSESMLWQSEPEGFAALNDSLALRWSTSLPDEDRRLIRAYVAWRHGDYETADTLDRSVMRADPANVEAAFQFGEVLFHYNTLRGRSIGEAGAWFDRTLMLDSANWGARWHMLLLDASRLGGAEFRERLARLSDAKPDGHLAAELRLFAADRSELPQLAAGATPAMLFDAAWRRAVFRHDLSGAETLLVRMTDRSRSEYDRLNGWLAIASLRFGEGRVADALPFVQTEEATRLVGGEARVILVHGLLVNRADSAMDLGAVARTIESWRQTLAGFDQPTHAPRLIARYLEGLIAAARGDTVGAVRAATDLDDLGRRPDLYVPAEFRNPLDLAQTVRAYSEFRRGRCEAALHALDQEKGTYWLGNAASSPIASQSFERYIRAECLMALGRNAEAGAWFGTFEQGTIYDLEFLSASLRGQAAARRAVGDAEAAKNIEQRLAQLRAK